MNSILVMLGLVPCLLAGKYFESAGGSELGMPDCKANYCYDYASKSDLNQ